MIFSLQNKLIFNLLLKKHSVLEVLYKIEAMKHNFLKNNHTAEFFTYSLKLLHNLKKLISF